MKAFIGEVPFRGGGGAWFSRTRCRIHVVWTKVSGFSIESHISQVAPYELNSYVMAPFALSYLRET